MVKGLFLALLVLAVLEGIAWFVYTESKRIEIRPEETVRQAEQLRRGDSIENFQAPDNNIASDILRNIENNDKDVQLQETSENKTVVREIDMIARQWRWEPSMIRVRQGDRVRLNITNVDVLHGIVIPELGVDNTDIKPGETKAVEFVADKKGRFEFLCSTFCGDRHIEMAGVIVVE